MPVKTTKPGSLPLLRFLLLNYQNWRVAAILLATHAAAAGQQLFTLRTFGRDFLAAFLVAGFLEMLVLTQLLGQTFFFAGLLETPQNLLKTFTSTSFDSDHKNPQHKNLYVRSSGREPYYPICFRDQSRSGRIDGPQKWRPCGDSNPGRRLERPLS